MSEKCFCHFNGYEVKDAAARAAAAQLSEGQTRTEESISQLRTETQESISQLSEGQTRTEESISQLQSFTDDIVTPQMYGAFADGKHDDSEAINAALNSGKKVYFPAGTYIMMQPFMVATTGRIYMFGDGTQKTVIRNTSYSENVLSRAGATAWYPDGFVVEGIYFEMQSSFCVRYCQLGVIRNCSFTCIDQEGLSPSGIVLSNECHYFTVENCRIRSYGTGYTNQASNGCVIRNTYIDYCETPLNIVGNYTKIQDIDIEGYNGMSIIASDENVLSNIHMERNNVGTWLQVTGNNNVIDVSAHCDGGAYYQPLLEVTGKRNVITVKGAGYTVANTVVQSNKIKLMGTAGIMNAFILPADVITNATVEVPDGKIMYEYNEDGTGGSLEWLLNLDGAEVNGNQIVYTKEWGTATLKISDILASNNATGCYVVLQTDAGAGTCTLHYGAPSSVNMNDLYMFSDILFAEEDISIVGNVVGASTFIRRIIIMEYGNQEVFDEIGRYRRSM